jgi:Phosphoribosyl-ATP pyrophosphohydrolase
MNQVQLDVMAFHYALDIPVYTGLPVTIPALRRPALRAELIMEEACETASAILGKKVRCRIGEESHPPSLVRAIDGLCDILCVTYGSALEWGIDLEPFWREVHRTNLKKTNGPTRADGKKLKPPGWEPPRIDDILSREIQLRELEIRYNARSQ